MSEEQDWKDMKVEEVIRVTKEWQQNLHALRVYLWFNWSHNKLQGWEYGDYPLDPVIGGKRFGWVDFNKRYQDKPDNMFVSFWRTDKAPMELRKGRPLTDAELRSLEPLITEFLKAHPDLEVSTEVEDWNIMCRFSKKK